MFTSVPGDSDGQSELGPATQTVSPGTAEYCSHLDTC